MALGRYGLSYPDFMRVLGADVVEAKIGEEADSTVGNHFGRLGKSVMLGDVGIGRNVKSATGPHHQSLTAEPAQVLRMDSARGQIADPQDAQFSGEIENGFGG